LDLLATTKASYSGAQRVPTFHDARDNLRFGWIDCFSRVCVSLRAYSDERLPAMEHSL